MECSQDLVTHKASDHDTLQKNSSPTAASTEDLQNEPEAINSQTSDATTITLSSPSQTIGMDSGDEFGANSKNFAEKECQTMDGVFLSTNDYKALLAKATFCPNFKNDLIKIRSHISNLPQPEMDPTAFERICRDVGAENLYNCIKDAICSDRMSDERKYLSQLGTMVVIYIMVYSQSQRSNSFQVALSRTLQQFGISEQALQSLRNLGIAAHPHTVKAQSKLSASSHPNHVASFIESAIEKKQFMIFCIDDYHNNIQSIDPRPRHKLK